jgi:nitrous oxidase accessory protein
VRNNRFLRNRGPSGYGIGLKDTDGFTIENNILSGNRVGMYLDNSPVVRTTPVLIARNTIAVNDVGMQFLPSVKGNTLIENSLIDNFEQVSILGRGELTGNEFDRNGRGNFWSDYSGYDADRDGVGDSEYESRRLFESLVDREPKLRILLFSPVQQAIEFVGRALPAVQPEPRFSDPSPLMRPAGASLPAAVEARGHGCDWAAALLLGVPVLISWAVFGERMRVCLPDWRRRGAVEGARA